MLSLSVCVCMKVLPIYHVKKNIYIFKTACVCFTYIYTFFRESGFHDDLPRRSLLLHDGLGQSIQFHDGITYARIDSKHVR